MIQVRLKALVRRIRTDNETEFVNQTLSEYYEKVGISYETSVVRTPQQNSVVERHNRKALVRRIRTDNETEFVNQTLHEYYEKVGISHETSVVRTPQQNGAAERHNRTLIKAARTILHFIKEQVKNGVVELYFVNTEYQLADIFTKVLCREIIEFLINKLGMRSFTPETLLLLADEAEE
nr:putative ribonuclease H-like domain-containing protein [Tanacetum cinerariifolium]